MRFAGIVGQRFQPIACIVSECLLHPGHEPHATTFVWQECAQASTDSETPEVATNSTELSSMAGASTSIAPS